MTTVTISETDGAFLAQVREAMEFYFGADQRRIAHALKVTAHARFLLGFIDAQPVLTLAACYLHDIGIPEAERKYGCCAGKQQEVEGPPVARQILQRLGVDPELIDAVCLLVSRHHTPAGVDSPEFRILWDADALVNLTEVVSGKEQHRIEEILSRSLVTEPGYRRACQLYLPTA
mgnify:CR=1 FL=1